MVWQVQGNIKGPKGDPGDPGPKGDPGEDGAGIELAGSVPTYGDLPDDLGPGDAGSGYLVQADGKLYIWDGTQWPTDGDGVAFRGPKGDKGDQGDKGDKGDKGDQGDKGDTGNTGADGTAATIDVGTVSTGAAGSSASIQNVGTPNEAVFDFVIPRGDKGETGEQGIQGIPGEKGDDGTAATIAAGTTSTGSPGSNATVTNVGTANAAVFNFTIPRGEQGIAGQDGRDGSRWWTGTGAPGTVSGAVPGDLYLDVADGTVYELT